MPDALNRGVPAPYLLDFQYSIRDAAVLGPAELAIQVILSILY